MKIDIKAESFPWQAKLLGVLFLIIAIANVAFWWVSILLAVGGVILILGHSGTIIDTNSRTVKEYTSYLFIKSGSTERFNHAEKLYINGQNISEKMYTAHTLNSSTFRSVVFNAYLKLDNGKKIFLTSRKNKTDLITLLRPVANGLETELVDNTDR